MGSNILAFADAEYMEEGDVIIFSGSNPLEAMTPHCAYAQRIVAAKERGVRVVTIDPRLSNTAKLSNGSPAHNLPGWIKCVPGAEGLVVLGMLKALDRGDVPGVTWDELTPSNNHGKNSAGSGYGFDPQGSYGEEPAGQLVETTLSGAHAMTDTFLVDATTIPQVKFDNLVGAQIALSTAPDSLEETLDVIAVGTVSGGTVTITTKQTCTGSYAGGARFTEDLNLRQHARGLTWSKITGETGLAQSTITDLANLFFSAAKDGKHAVWAGYRGECAHTNGMQNSRPGQLLNAFVPANWDDSGNWGTRGGYAKYKSGTLGGAPSTIANNSGDYYSFNATVAADAPAGSTVFTVGTASAAKFAKLLVRPLTAYRDVALRSTHELDRGGTVESGTVVAADTGAGTVTLSFPTANNGSRYSHAAGSRIRWELPDLTFAAIDQSMPRALSRTSHMLFPNLAMGRPYPLGVLIQQYMAWNLMGPDADFVTRALQNETLVPYHIAFDVFLGETSAYADIVFPDTSYLERWDFVNTYYLTFVPKISVRQPVIQPLYESREQREFYYDLPNIVDWDGTFTGPVGQARMAHSDTDASEGEFGTSRRRIGTRTYSFDGNGTLLSMDDMGTFGPPDQQSVRYGTGPNGNGIADPYGVLYWAKRRTRGTTPVVPGASDAERLAYFMQNGMVYGGPEAYSLGKLSVTAQQLTGNRTLAASSPKVAAFSLVLAGTPTPGDTTSGVSDGYGDSGFRGLPEWYPPDRTLARPQDDLFLITYKTRIHTQSRTGPIPTLKEIEKENLVWMNPVDATARGVSEGDKVLLEARLATGRFESIEAQARVTEEVMDGVVALSGSFGHRHSGKYTVDGTSNRHDTPDEDIRDDGYQNTGAGVNRVIWNTTDFYGGSANFLDTLVSVMKL